MKEKVTIYSLAKELGMSPSMVSRALSQNGRVDEEKRKKVLKAAAKYDFTPNKFASRMSGKTIRIGCIFASKSPRLEEEMEKGVKNAFLKLKDYKVNCDITSVFLLNNPDSISQLNDALEKYASYDGIIVSGMSDAKFTSLFSKLDSEKTVQLQSINEGVEYLFASHHNEKLASCAVCDFIYHSIKHEKEKNVLLLTGDVSARVHYNAREAFIARCNEMGMNVKTVFNMLDDEQYLKENIKSILTDDIKAVYITSGNSLSLCEYVKNSGKNIVLVTTDTYPELNQYLIDNTVAITVDQDISKQAENAFYYLAMHIINGEKIEKNIFTEFKLKTASMIEGK